MMASPTICVFEDEQHHAFLPLVYTRPVFDLVCGMQTLFQKIESAYDGCVLRQLCRPYLIRTAGSDDKPSLVGGTRDFYKPFERVLFINGRILARDSLADLVPPEGEDALYVSGESLVAARLSGARLQIAIKWLAEQDTASIMASLAREIPVHRLEIEMVEYPWDLIHRNGAEIRIDFARLARGGQGDIHPGAMVYERENVHVAPSAEVMAGAVLDARSGPIIISREALVEPFSFIQGPAYIGPHSRIVSGRIREDTSIGPYCRIGGEVECCIFHGYSNKYHDGFTGHSYFGEWVNIGALTTTSDLKNTYGTVRIDIDGGQVDTGHTKLGSFLGDHVKLGIGVLLNSGSTIGTGCNLFGGGMLPKVVPCFIWGGNGEYQEYDFERMLETAQIAMGRRQVEQTEAHSELLRYIFEVTAPLRREGRI
jgi:UDP-N-acetylglucosamine diphosphorylase / glucose-1-phosphate thymidylyltransferase / UDP-N-acetylgalactosamine diphosphorylase / glucosamine-1-phosphate N-acetyltransferase / galactosamine-1-phosphate N-acetyltransferase